MNSYQSWHLACLSLITSLLLSACAAQLPSSTASPEATGVKLNNDDTPRDGNFLQHPDYPAFAAKLAAQGYPHEQTAAMLTEAKFLPSVVSRMDKPAEGLTWAKYRSLFIKPERIAEAQSFMQAHAATLARAERDFGVPATVIAAILSVETRFGRYLGKDRVLDALATLAFGYPRRAEFFNTQLEVFLLQAERNQLNPKVVKGSYAGAMGLPQFIPSSYRDFAIDYDGDGYRDLWNSPADAIGSIGNYLQRHNWLRHAPIAVQKTPLNAAQAASWSKLSSRYGKPEYDQAELRRLDLPTAANFNRAALIELDGEKGSEFWLTSQNFYAITRYNHSRLYAMAVYQLSVAFAEAESGHKASQ